MHEVGTIAQQCLFLTEVRAQTDDGSKPQMCNYPNNASTGHCTQITPYVLNNSGENHGLRGVSFY